MAHTAGSGNRWEPVAAPPLAAAQTADADGPGADPPGVPGQRFPGEGGSQPPAGPDDQGRTT